MKRLAFALAVIFALCACGKSEAPGTASSAAKAQGLSDVAEFKSNLSAQLKIDIADRVELFKSQLQRISFETSIGAQLYPPAGRNRVYLESQLNYTVRKYQEALAGEANVFLDSVEIAAGTMSEKDAIKKIAELDKAYNRYTEAASNKYKSIYETVFLGFDIRFTAFERTAQNAESTLKAAYYKNLLDDVAIESVKEARKAVSAQQRELFTLMAASASKDDADRMLAKTEKIVKVMEMRFDGKILALAAKERLFEKYGERAANWDKYIDTQTQVAVYKVSGADNTSTLNEEIAKVESYVEGEIKKRM